MKLSDYLPPDHIFTAFSASGKAEALEKLCRLAAELAGGDYGDFLKVVLDREALGSTGLGGGVALPHGKSSGLERPVLVMAVSPRGIDFDSLDGRPVKILVLMLTPKEGDGGEHLQLLAGLGRLLQSASVVEEIEAAADSEEIFNLLSPRA